MTSERQHAAAPLPPSPLTPVVEVPPFSRVALPWHVLAYIGGCVLGATMLVGLPLMRVDQYALLVWVPLAIVLVPRHWVAGLAAVLLDRAAPSWPRAVRWGVAMGLIGLLPGVEYFRQVPAPIPQWLHQPPIPQWLWGWK